jgi:hypothetical protein
MNNQRYIEEKYASLSIEKKLKFVCLTYKLACFIQKHNNNLKILDDANIHPFTVQFKDFQYRYKQLDSHLDEKKNSSFPVLVENLKHDISKPLDDLTSIISVLYVNHKDLLDFILPFIDRTDELVHLPNTMSRFFPTQESKRLIKLFLNMVILTNLIKSKTEYKTLDYMNEYDLYGKLFTLTNKCIMEKVGSLFDDKSFTITEFIYSCGTYALFSIDEITALHNDIIHKKFTYNDIYKICANI